MLPFFVAEWYGDAMKQARQRWSIDHVKTGRDTGVYVLDIGKVKAGDTYKIFAMSDLHMDSRKHNKKLADKHMQEACDGGWPMLFYGDSYDAKESRFDPRRGGTKRGGVEQSQRRIRQPAC